MFRQLAIIIGCLAVGEFIVWLTGITMGHLHKRVD